MQRHVASAFSASSNIGCNDSQSTNYDSRNDLRFAYHFQYPVQKQGRPVPNQRSGQAERLSARARTNQLQGKGV
jgi:hypothetical protein